MEEQEAKEKVVYKTNRYYEIARSAVMVGAVVWAVLYSASINNKFEDLTKEMNSELKRVQQQLDDQLKKRCDALDSINKEKGEMILKYELDRNKQTEKAIDELRKVMTELSEAEKAMNQWREQFSTEVYEMIQQNDGKLRNELNRVLSRRL